MIPTMTARINPMMNTILASSMATPVMNPNPKSAATRATMRNVIASLIRLIIMFLSTFGFRSEIGLECYFYGLDPLF